MKIKQKKQIKSFSTGGDQKSEIKKLYFDQKFYFYFDIKLQHEFKIK